MPRYPPPSDQLGGAIGVVPLVGMIIPRRGINVPGRGTFVPGRGNARKAVPFGRLLAVSVGSHFVKNPPVPVCF